MPTVVIGTAGHIDHGKSTLLQALTGIDADRLPEEQARGMTIDVGFAHLDLDDGTSLDFVDVPGHDRLVGNMLVGAGEIDAVLLVVAADDGPRAQTLEHVELLDALGLERGIVAITKADAVPPARLVEVRDSVTAMLAPTRLAGSSVIEVSSLTGSGIQALRRELVALRDAVLGDLAGRPPGPAWLAIDRAFGVKGRGLVVTGTLRGGTITPGAELVLVPGGGRARVREVQVHHGRAAAATGGRTALNVAGVPNEAVARGTVLTAAAGTDGGAVEASDRLLVVLRRPVTLRHEPPVAWPPGPAAALRLHCWTSTTDAAVRPARGRVVGLADGRAVAVLALAAPIAAMPGAPGVVRDPGSSRTVAGVTVLDLHPPRGVSRRRMTTERLAALAAAATPSTHARAPSHVAAATAAGDPAAVATAMLDLHGAMVVGTRLGLASDVAVALRAAAEADAARSPTVAELRTGLRRALRQLVTIERSADAAATAAIDALIDELLAAGRMVRDGDRIRPAGAVSPEVLDARAAAMARLELALDVDVPPGLSEAVRAAGPGADADLVAALERTGRIVRVDDDLAWATARYAALRDRAIEMARRGPLAPAAFRDAIGGNRRIVMPLLEDFDRKGYLRRTDAGHLPGPRA